MSTTPSSVPRLPSYPASFNVDYPDRSLNRLTSFFRIFMLIPIGIIITLLVGGWGEWGERMPGWNLAFTSAGIVIVPLVLMILFRKKYPKWWFDWNLALVKFGYRVGSYFALLRDEYPSTDEEQAVHVDMVYPDVQSQLGRGMPLIKWFLAIPHWIILYFLWIGAWFCIIISWFAILFTGHYPKGFFEFVVGVMRWGFRVEAYAILMITDQYPPFSLEN